MESKKEAEDKQNQLELSEAYKNSLSRTIDESAEVDCIEKTNVAKQGSRNDEISVKDVKI